MHLTKTGRLTWQPCPERLVMAASGLQAGLDTIDRKASSIAENLTLNGIRDEDLAGMLSQGLDIPGVLEVTLMDETGRLQTIVPASNKRFQGEDVSGQDFNTRLISYPVPGMSGYFTTVEGMDAVILSWPVFSDEKRTAGFVCMLIDPVNLTGRYAMPFLNGTGYDLMVAQPDGKILYDGHQGMNGQVICNNSVFSGYPDLLSWAAHFQNAEAGVDRYSFYKEDSEDIVKTDVTWTTVSLHGTPWRIFILKR